MTSGPVIQFPQRERTAPTTVDLVRQVKLLANADSMNIRMDIPHFQKRMVDRGIDMRSVLEVLRKGRASGRPNLDEYGDWTITMVRKVAGRRVEVVVAVHADHIDCITAW